MAIIVVGGSGRSVGKTTLACALIAALPSFRWSAVKISGHLHHPEPVWEETAAGEGSDTARYLAAGAQRAMLVSTLDGIIPIAALRSALAQDKHILFESNRILAHYQPDLCLAVCGPSGLAPKPSFAALVSNAHAFVALRKADTAADTATFGPPPAVPVFSLGDFQVMSPELLAWLRAHLTR